uniref:YqaJ viral recombinase domain-containing protein n=1 Tax=Oryzias latipes TaxID=8090 RepID=A0A3P9LPB7_ORYLA
MQTQHSCPRKCMSVISTAFDTDDNVIAHFSAPDMIGLSMVPGTILHHVLTAQAQTVHSEIGPPKEHTLCAEQKCTLCNTTFHNYVKCGEQERLRLLIETKGQNSKLWLDQRKIRITSSEACEVPKKVHPTNWVERKLNTNFTGNEASRYGQQAEPLARQCFEETTGLTVETTGLFVHDQENWLGASLDGIIDTDTILEIKCPTSKKLEAHGGSLLKMIESNKYDVRMIDGKYTLRETASGSGYYYQVQVAMHCAKKRNCKFMVWTPNEHVILDVPYNKEWTISKICHLKSVYFQYLLPAVATRIEHGVMKICGLK